MVAKVGDQGSFTNHLNAFQNAGYISLIQRDALRTILDVGDAATHRSFKPTIDDLNTALDVAPGVPVGSSGAQRSAFHIGASGSPSCVTALACAMAEAFSFGVRLSSPNDAIQVAS